MGVYFCWVVDCVGIFGDVVVDGVLFGVRVNCVIYCLVGMCVFVLVGVL